MKEKERIEFCNKIKQMLRDEENAQDEYFALLGLSPEANIIIESIMKDEEKHHDMLKKLNIIVCENSESFGMKCLKEGHKAYY
jgi:hypothetical protein